MKATQNGQTWVYTQHPRCEVCGHDLDFVPVLLKDGLKVCPGCAGVSVGRYFYPHTVALGECGCRGDTRCEGYFEALEAWRTAAEFAVRRGKIRDEWRARWWHATVRLHELRAERSQIIRRIFEDLKEEFRHWLSVERPPIQVALANIGHIVNVAMFITQGYDTTALESELKQLLSFKQEEQHDTVEV